MEVLPQRKNATALTHPHTIIAVGQYLKLVGQRACKEDLEANAK
jgi:hypothetical protein